MKAIGFRAEKDAITWAVVNNGSTPHTVEGFDKIKVPDSYSEAEKLALFRERVQSQIQEWAPDVAAIRYPETKTRQSRTPKSDQLRLRVEGVILEAVQSVGLEIMTGALATIGARLGTKSAKKYLERDDVRGMKFPRKSLVVKDAVIVADAALGARRGKSGTG